MGKRKDTSTEEEIVIDGDLLPAPIKKHKKHKHKKHKKKKTELEFDNTSDIFTMAISTQNDEDLDSLVIATSQPKLSLSTSSTPPKSAKKKKKGKDSGTSSEEERWLDAIESGKLEEVDDELKKIKPKDPKLMTARQRAMLERKTSDPSTSTETLLALPSGYREKVMTPEMALKAQLKSQKRKQQADEKREKDKKKTMERLLRKQESKTSKSASAKVKASKRLTPSVTLTNSLDGITISLPPGMDFPLAAARVKDPPPMKLCGVPGCSNTKKYSCSKTGIPLCSLECYRRNMSRTI